MSEPQSSTVVGPPAVTTPPKEPRPGALPPSPDRPKRSVWPWILLLLIAGAAVYYYLNYWKKPASSTQGQPEGGAQTGSGSGGNRKGGRGGGGVIPIVAVKAQKGNIGVYYSTPANVVPIYTVTVHTRVDGQLMSVNFKEGDLVKKGDLLAEIDPRPFQAQLTQYEGQIIRDKALLDNARVDQTRYETLLKQNAVPEQQLTTQKSLVSQDEGIVKMDQGLIDSVKVNLVYCRITAEITGRVGLRLVDPGNIVHAADANGLIVITQLQPISVIFPVAEDTLPSVMQKLRAGQTLTVDAYDREIQHKLATGVVSTTDNIIDQTTGTLKLRATFDNSHNELFPNQFVNARLLIQMKSGVILLPTAAIQRNTNSTYVWDVKPDSTVTVRTITTGTVEGDQTEILTGLNAGETTVMTGVDKLQEGSKVNVQFEGDKRKAGSGAGTGTPGANGTPQTGTGNGKSKRPDGGGKAEGKQ